MASFLTDFENLSAYLDVWLLLGPGIILAIFGLCLWLGGIKWQKSIGSISLALIAAGGVLIVKPHLVAICVTFVVGLMVGRFFYKQSISFAGILMGLILATVIILNFSNFSFTSSERFTDMPADKLDLASSLAVINNFVVLCSSNIFRVIKSLAFLHYIIIAATTAAFSFISIMWNRFFVSLFCSCLGTIFTSAGMSLLLLFKGTAVISRVQANLALFVLLFCGMVLAGTLVQLLLSIGGHKTKADSKETGEKND